MMHRDYSSSGFPTLYFPVFLLLVLMTACTDPPPEQIRFDFWPSFHPVTSYTLSPAKKELRLNCYPLSHWEEEAQNDSSLYYKNTFPVPEPALEKFLSKVEEVDLKESVEHWEEGILDGITFRYSEMHTSGDTLSISAAHPRRVAKYHDDFQLLDALFQLTKVTLTDSQAVKITQDIKAYLPY